MLEYSVVILARDEEYRITNAIRSASGAREVIVGVDTRTIDATASAARAAGATVVAVDAREGFSAAKNTLLGSVPSQWAMLLDADEALSSGLRRELREMTLPRHLSAFMVRRDNVHLGRRMRHGGWDPDWHVRLIDVQRHRFDGRSVHETISVKDPVGRLRSPILHYTHVNVKEILTKLDVYSDLELAELPDCLSSASSGPRIVGSALKEFLRRLVLEHAYRDGDAGWLEAVFWSFYRFTILAKQWERQRNPNDHMSYQEWQSLCE